MARETTCPSTSMVRRHHVRASTGSRTPGTFCHSTRNSIIQLLPSPSGPSGHVDTRIACRFLLLCLT